MDFPLETLPAAVNSRRETWTRLKLRPKIRPIAPNHGKPVVGAEFESASWLAEIMIWATGEAELSTIRLADDRNVNKHFDLAHKEDLDILLDEMVDLIAHDQIPDAAVITRYPEPPG